MAEKMNLKRKFFKSGSFLSKESAIMLISAEEQKETVRSTGGFLLAASRRG